VAVVVVEWPLVVATTLEVEEAEREDCFQDSSLRLKQLTQSL
jgi:hypothetical protein